MDYLRAIILILATAFSATAQPFQEAELGWRKNAGVFGGFSAYIIPKNTLLTNVLAGHANRGVTFSITTPPSHGAATGLDSRTGTNLYTPTLNYVGVDSMTYTVAANGTAAPGAIGYVHISVVDTNATCFTNCVEYCCLPIYFDSSGPCNSFSVSVRKEVIDPLKDYTLTAHDQHGQLSGTFSHTAGDPWDTWTPPATSSDNISAGFCLTLNSQPFFPVNNPICFTLCGSTNSMGPGDCENPTNEVWAFAANGGTYTAVTNQNYFGLTGSNPGNSGAGGGCFAPAFSTVTTAICNNESTNRTLILYGTWDWFAQGGVSSPGFAGNMNVNGSHFSLFNSGGSPHSDLSDCNVGSTFGSGGPLVVSNAITVVAGTTTNLTFNLRFYKVDAAAAQATVLNITNFWKP